MAEKNFSKLRAELDRIMAKLEDDSLDIDEAIASYEESQKIITEMDEYLKNSETKIKKLTQN